MKDLVELEGWEGAVFINPKIVMAVVPAGVAGFCTIVTDRGMYSVKGDTRSVYELLRTTSQKTPEPS